MYNQTTIKSNNKYSFVQRILTFNLFGYFLKSLMLYQVLKVALDDIPKFWCFILPFPEDFIPIVIVNILVGIIASIWFYKSENKNITFNSRHKFLLISPFLQLAIFVLIGFLTAKYV